MMRKKVMKGVALLTTIGALFCFTGTAQAYDVSGRGIVLFEYSQATSLPYYSRHHYLVQYPDGTGDTFYGNRAATYYKSYTNSRGLTVLNFGAEFYK